MDPGPGAFVYLHERGIDYERIKLIILSHIHLDHTADVNTLIEACSRGGKLKQTYLFAPKSALNGKERVVLPYLAKRLKGIGILKEGSSLEAEGITVRAVMRHAHHGAETYGVEIGGSVVYVSCARYEKRMLSAYPSHPRLLIINTTFYRKKPPIEHLSVEEVKELIAYLRPETTVITHFSLEMHDIGPSKVAEELSQELGLKVLAAHDGMELEL